MGERIDDEGEDFERSENTSAAGKDSSSAPKGARDSFVERSEHQGVSGTRPS